jgi:hypothetical protein
MLSQLLHQVRESRLQQPVEAGLAWNDLTCGNIYQDDHLLKMTKQRIALFGYSNIILFILLGLQYDAIERPNTIGHFSLAMSVMAFPVYYFFNDRDSKDALFFSFMFCLSLIATGHNINFLISKDYKGPYVVIDKSRARHGAESWRIQLENGKAIDLFVYTPPSGNGSNIRLKKGLLGVHFGTTPDGA